MLKEGSASIGGASIGEKVIGCLQANGGEGGGWESEERETGPAISWSARGSASLEGSLSHPGDKSKTGEANKADAGEEEEEFLA